MSGKDIRVRSSAGGEFDCYTATPAGDGKVPAIVLACAITGVDDDLRAIADEFAAHGYLAMAPDLFWRTIPGPLPRDHAGLVPRGQPRDEKITTGEADMADTLTELRKYPQFNGHAVAMGFCYGGPYAILSPKRLGYDGGVSCHGTRMLDYIHELEGVSKPVCIMWGDRDHAAPPEVLDAFRAVPARIKNVEVHVFPGVDHGYTMPGYTKGFHQQSRDFSMRRALSMLDGLRGQ